MTEALIASSISTPCWGASFIPAIPGERAGRNIVRKKRVPIFRKNKAITKTYHIGSDS